MYYTENVHNYRPNTIYYVILLLFLLFLSVHETQTPAPYIILYTYNYTFISNIKYYKSCKNNIF